MKCCGSPTTSIAASAPDDRRTVTGAMQALVFSEVLKPLATSLGPIGTDVVGSIAASLFARPNR